MTPRREIIRTLLDHRLPERVGLNEHFWPHIIENAWGAQGIGDEDFVRRFDLDYESVLWWSAPGPRPDLARTIEETDEWRLASDAWGAQTRYWKKKSGTPEHVGFTCTSPEAWKRDFREQFLGIDVRTTVDVAKIRTDLARARADDRFAVFSSLFVFEDLRRVLGDVCMLESLAGDQDFVTDFCDCITRKHLELWEHVFSAAGKPDGFHMYEDLGYTRGPFCSPRMHRQLIQPWHEKLFGFIKSHGIPLVVHTCGDFRPHLPALVACGVDCIQTLEAKTGMDVVKLAGEWKDRLTFMGNLDIRAFESGDRRLIHDECLGKLKGMTAQRAPYIFMSDHSISPAVRVADYEYALELFHANCRY
jgi:uroporphyrinogen decarboxylase